MPTVTMTQSSKQHEVLFQIKDFLEKNGVSSHLYTCHRPSSGQTRIPVSRLEVRSFCGVRKFLECVLPFLIVKAAKSLEMLDYINSQHWGEREFKPEVLKKLKAWKRRDLLEQWKNPQYREKMTAMSKSTWTDQTIRAKRLAGLRRAMENPETKRKHSEGLKKFWDGRKAGLV